MHASSSDLKLHTLEQIRGCLLVTAIQLDLIIFNMWIDMLYVNVSYVRCI